METWSAQNNWISDPALQEARIVLGPRKSKLNLELRQRPDFKMIYSDALAEVFIRDQKP